MRDKVIRVFYSLVIVGLIAANAGLYSWHKGFEIGYGAAMADVVLHITTPFDYFKARLGLK